MWILHSRLRDEYTRLPAAEARRVAAGDRRYLWRQSLSLYRIPAEPTRGTNIGLRLRCRERQDSKMSDRSFVPYPVSEGVGSDRPGRLTFIHPNGSASAFHRQRPGMVSTRHA